MYGDALVNLGVALGTSLVFSIVSVKTWKCVWRIHFATADEHGSCNSDDLQHAQDGIRAANWTVASWARWYLAARFTLSLASWAHLILNPSYAQALGFDVVGEAVLRLAHTATATCFAAFVATTVCALPAAATSHDDEGGPPSSMSHHHEETKILFGLGALLGAVGCWLRASVVFSSVFFSYMLIGISEVALNPLLDAAFIGAVAINIIQTTSTSSSSCSHSSPTPLVLELDADGYSRISSTDEIISSNSQQGYALVPTDDGLHPSQQTGENCWLIIAKMFCMAHLFDSMAPMALWIISSLFDAPADSVFMATGVAIAWTLLFWVRLDDHQQNNEFLLSKNAQNLHSTINNCCCNNEDDFTDRDNEQMVDKKWWESFGLSSVCFHAAFTTIVYASQWTFVSRTTMTASVDDVEPFLPIYSACKLFSSCCFTYCFFSKTYDGCSINFSSLTRVVSGTTIFLSILFLLMGFVNVVFALPLIAMQRFKFYAFCVTWLADGLLRPIFAILRISPLMKRYSKGKSENLGIQAFLTESSRIQAYTFPLIFCGSLWAHGEGRSMSDVTSPAGTGVMVFCSSMAIVSAIGACLMNRMEIGVTI